MNTQWNGKKVAFIGDSITDINNVSSKLYWQYLQDYLGIKPSGYGIGGDSWGGVIAQAKRVQEEHGSDVDAIFVFMGTNDYNGGRPLGEWWTIQEETVNSHGQMMTKQRRIFNYDTETYKGLINASLRYLKENFPLQQIVILTPIHRGYANFGGTNVQPEETFHNDSGIYVEEYIKILREAADIWSVPLIDLYRESGLYPVNDGYTRYFANPETDRLHPSAPGHERIARVMMYKMLSMPATFR